MTTIEYIREKLGEEELLCQLAEEAAELAQAALKLRRCITGKNPTPVTAMQAEANLVEELADVQLVAEVLNRGKRIQEKLNEIGDKKTERWSKRIEEDRNDGQT